jgi:hypothetical protein
MPEVMASDEDAARTDVHAADVANAAACEVDPANAMTAARAGIRLAEGDRKDRRHSHNERDVTQHDL